MKKVLSITFIILIILALTGGAVGMYLHNKPVDKPIDESLVLSTRDYGTFTFIKGNQISNTYDMGIPSRINGLLLPNANINAVMLDNYYSNNDTIPQSYKLVVIPEFNIETRTQNTIAGTHINYAEKVVSTVQFASGGILADNIEAYVLQDNILTYNKAYEDIPAEEKRFSIGFLKLSSESSPRTNIYFWADAMWQKSDSEYMFFTSDKNCVFAQNLFLDFIMAEEG